MILIALLLAEPQYRHDMMPGMAMPGMAMPKAPARKQPAPRAKAVVKKAKPRSAPRRVSGCTAEHAAMGHCRAGKAVQTQGAVAAKDHGGMPGMAMDHGAMPGMASNPGASACTTEHEAMGHCRMAESPQEQQGKPPVMGHGGMPGMAMDHGTMPGMASKPGAPVCTPEHEAMGHCRSAVSTQGQDGAATMPGMVMDHSAMPGMAAGQGMVGDAPPPAAPTDRAADRFYDPAVMAAANAQMRAEHGGMRFSQILFNLAEIQVRDGREGYRWDGEGWFGGDIHRLVVKTEGEGTFGRSVGAAEVQALYARAIDPYWNLQAGLRQDVGSGARRTYAVIGIEGLAPYWFDVEGALFLSDKGEVLARAEAWVDQRLTQRAILQPRLEVNLAAQDVPEQRIAAGVSNIELGLRLRYEIAREFAPYVGVTWERRYGPAGGSGAALALGIRTWF
ncbi:copper resistance protein B [Sphingomonas sp. CFBP8993]|uniref:copper resistance protein B n=1 Tax=Sphingomonas sp. CFBP8993 TaxID=3096526 RepID=UPI002A6B7FE7|nr:copper resistance protein B [Sphingomonas sp. CFBP8993]MDY0960365.1 copper resistance protein B [Sphingomonas sp. CFBP8993]